MQWRRHVFFFRNQRVTYTTRYVVPANLLRRVSPGGAFSRESGRVRVKRPVRLGTSTRPVPAR